MYTIHRGRNFIAIENFLTDDESDELTKMPEPIKKIQETKTFDEYSTNEDKKKLMIYLFDKFIKIIQDAHLPSDPYYKICEKVKKIFMNIKRLNIIRMHFKPIFENKAIDYHYDTWSNWNFICSIGGPSITILKNYSCVMPDKSAYLFNGAEQIHAVSLIRDDKYIHDDTYRQCFQLRHYDYSAYIVNCLKNKGKTQTKSFMKYKKRFEERKLKLINKAKKFITENSTEHT